MTQSSHNDPHRTTTASTDTEAGAEQLPEDQDREQSLKALEAMYKRGLIPEEEYQARLKELNA